MTAREKNLCRELAEFLCYPRAFEIGGVENKLRDIIKCVTKNNPLLMRQVMEFCKEMVSSGDYDVWAYGTSEEKMVLEMMEQDYFSVFYRK